LGSASGGNPSKAPARANESAWDAVEDGIIEISGTSAAEQHVMLAVPPQQWLAQSDTSASRVETEARAISRRTMLGFLDLTSPATSAVAGTTTGSAIAAAAWL
jgi:hypothetical protein